VQQVRYKTMQSLRIKICGITNAEQGQAIAQLGAHALGFICAPASPRYVTPEQIRQIVDSLESTTVRCVGVFVDTPAEQIAQIVAIAQLTAIQLHGGETPEFCRDLRQRLPQIELIKALRVRDRATLDQTQFFVDWVDTFLLDAYHPQLHGGTGKTLDWSALQTFSPGRPWLLAGGLTPLNVNEALRSLSPDGIDLSSGVELSPGQKDLSKVLDLFEQLRHALVG
jgi:phosphoribosylanthranilate isomerase